MLASFVADAVALETFHMCSMACTDRWSSAQPSREAHTQSEAIEIIESN